MVQSYPSFGQWMLRCVIATTLAAVSLLACADEVVVPASFEGSVPHATHADTTSPPHDADRTTYAIVPPSPVPYFAPSGFAGAHWGDSLTEVALNRPLQFVFYHLASDREEVQFYADRCTGSPKESVYSCIGSEPVEARAPDSQDVHAVLLMEYRKPGVSFYIPETRAYFDQVRYQFCATYLGEQAVAAVHGDPARMRADVHLCGIRLMFNSSTVLPAGAQAEAPSRADWAGVESPGVVDAISDNETRVLRALEHAFGPPVPPPAHPHRGASRLQHHTWCPDVVDSVQINCASEVMYAFDNHTHSGMVALATPAVFAYLFDRRKRQVRGESLEVVDLYFLLLLRNPPVRFTSSWDMIASRFEPQAVLTPQIQAQFDVNDPSPEPSHATAPSPISVPSLQSPEPR